MAGDPVAIDRLGSVRARGNLKFDYFPWGEEKPSATQNDTDKFGTYYRDQATGLDYAMNRYYASTAGRFTSADPYQSADGAAVPVSWNRYAYSHGDPVNLADPDGLDPIAACINSIQIASQVGASVSTMSCYNPYAVYVNGAQVNTGSTLGTSGTGEFGSLGGQSFGGNAGVLTLGVCAVQPELCVLGGVLVGAYSIYVAMPALQGLFGPYLRDRAQRDPPKVRVIPRQVSGTRDPDGDCIPPPPEQKGPAGWTYKWQQRSAAPNAAQQGPIHWHWTDWRWYDENCEWWLRGRGDEDKRFIDPGPGYELIPGIW